MSEEPPADFTCVICERDASNKWNHSARHFERPPICKSCEEITGFSWNGGALHRTKPTGGTFRDKREALRIGALADAIASEANRQHWETKLGRS